MQEASQDTLSVTQRIQRLRQRNTGVTDNWGARAAQALAKAGALWQKRLESGWTPPTADSAFPWVQVRLSLEALVPGLVGVGEWRGNYLSPLPPPRSGEGGPAMIGSLALSPLSCSVEYSQEQASALSPPLRFGEGEGGRGNLVVALILAGNTPLMSWSPLAACLLAGATIFVKMSREETLWPRLFVEALAEIDPEVAGRIVLDVWPGEDTRTAELVRAADAVVAFGADATLEALKAITPPQTPFFGFSHAVSIGLLLESGDVAGLRAFARDALLYGQGGCLSLQAVLYDARAWAAIPAAKELYAAMREQAETLECPPVADPADAAAIRAARDMALFEGLDVLPYGNEDDLRCTVISDYALADAASVPTPMGPGVVPLIPFENLEVKLPRLLGPLRGRVSCVGVAGTVTPELHGILTAEGVSRVCAAGEMQRPPLDWPNGGRDLLSDLLSVFGRERDHS